MNVIRRWITQPNALLRAAALFGAGMALTLAAACLSSKAVVSTMALTLMGSTIPEVPKMEMPPSIPKWGLKVLWAICSPAGTEMVTWSPPSYPV